MDVRSQNSSASSDHQTLPCSRLSFRAVTPNAHRCTCAPDKASAAQRPGGHVFSPVTKTDLRSPRENSGVRVPPANSGWAVPKLSSGAIGSIDYKEHGDPNITAVQGKLSYTHVLCIYRTCMSPSVLQTCVTSLGVCAKHTVAFLVKKKKMSLTPASDLLTCYWVFFVKIIKLFHEYLTF